MPLASASALTVANSRGLSRMRSLMRACSNSGDRPEDLEEHPPERGGGVDSLLQDDEVDVALLKSV